MEISDFVLWYAAGAVSAYIALVIIGYFMERNRADPNLLYPEDLGGK